APPSDAACSRTRKANRLSVNPCLAISVAIKSANGGPVDRSRRGSDPTPAIATNYPACCQFVASWDQAAWPQDVNQGILQPYVRRRESEPVRIRAAVSVDHADDIGRPHWEA